MKQLKRISVVLLFFFVAYWTSTTLLETRFPEVGAPPKLYANQLRDDLRLHFQKAIENANDTITLAIYTLTDPTIVAALRKKSEEGLKVTIICDAKTCANLERVLGSSVRVIKRFGKGLMHRKILVIDEKQVWLGSANMTTESLRMHGNLVAGVEDPYFAQLVEEKLVGLEDSSYHKLTIGGQPVELSFLPEDAEGLQRIKDLLRTAQKTIHVAMYTWTRKDLATEIIQAQKRGVITEVVMDRGSAKGANKKVARQLKEGGILTKLSGNHGLLHHKFLYIDGKILVHGSANWTKAAFTQNDDCFMIHHNLTDEQHEQMENLWQLISSEAKKL